MLKYFGYKFKHEGEIKMDILVIIPFILYISKSRIKKPEKKSGGVVWSLHITPWLAIGIVGRFTDRS